MKTERYKIRNPRIVWLKRSIYFITFLLLAISIGVAINYQGRKAKPIEIKPKNIEGKKAITVEAIEPPKIIIADSFLLNIPYTVQAPLTNWNVHEESCEEAALLMIHYYLSGNQVDIIPPATANQELINLVAWQISNYGGEKDLGLSEIGKLGSDYYGYKYQVTEDITAENIKLTLSEGKPVIVSVITHALRNPYYGPNPTYHILVIKGYNQQGVITNDAGVKEGKDFFYTWDILWQAIDAQTAQMNQGRDMLVVTK